MPKKAMSVREAARVAERLAEEMQYEYVDIELAKEPTGRFLRVFVEKEGGISLDDLEAYHRRLQPMVENVDYDYMEVSSPGADRPLKTEKDFQRAEGLLVEVKTYRALDGAKQFSGDLVGLKDGVITILESGGRERRFQRADVALIRPLIEFDEEDLQDDIDIE